VPTDDGAVTLLLCEHLAFGRMMPWRTARVEARDAVFPMCSRGRTGRPGFGIAAGPWNWPTVTHAVHLIGAEISAAVTLLAWSATQPGTCTLRTGPGVKWTWTTGKPMKGSNGADRGCARVVGEGSWEILRVAPNNTAAVRGAPARDCFPVPKSDPQRLRPIRSAGVPLIPSSDVKGSLPLASAPKAGPRDAVLEYTKTSYLADLALSG